MSLHSVHLSNLGFLAVITWLQLYSNSTCVKSKHKSHCLILFASCGSYTTSQQYCTKLHVIKNFHRDTAVTTPVDVFSQFATNTYYITVAFNLNASSRETMMRRLRFAFASRSLRVWCNPTSSQHKLYGIPQLITTWICDFFQCNSRLFVKQAANRRGGAVKRIRGRWNIRIHAPSPLIIISYVFQFSPPAPAGVFFGENCSWYMWSLERLTL